jgi:tetratricopeptide (TPR) repeat protein
MAGNKATYDTAMKRAHQYAWSNQWERALKEYSRALTEQPDDLPARRNVAQCYFKLKQWPQAQEAYGSLLATDPRDFFALGRLAEIYLALGRQDQALATYNHLADLYMENNQVHEAMRALLDLSRAMPRNMEVHNRILLMAQELGDRQTQVGEHLAISKIALDENNLGEASAHADAAVALDPENAEVKRWNYAVRKRITEAVGTGKIEGDQKTQQGLSTMLGTGLIGAKEADPPEAAALIAQAGEAQERGEYQEALALYERAVQSGARSAAAFYNAGLLNHQLGRPTTAITYLERASSDPEFATSACYVTGLCYTVLRDHERAVAAYERAISLINVAQLTRNEADELIELYTSAAEANMAANHPGRAGSLYTNLVSLFKERRWQHPDLPELERKSDELYNTTIASKLEGISRGSTLLNPEVAAPKGTHIIQDEEESGTSFMNSTALDTSSMGTSSMGTSSMGTSSMGTSSIEGTLSDGEQGTSFMTSSEGEVEQGTSFMTDLNSEGEQGTSLMGGPGSTEHDMDPPQERTGRMSKVLDTSALRELQQITPHGEVDSLDATRLMAAEETGEDGTNLLKGGTKGFDVEGEGARPAPSADIPTTVMSRPGSNLRTITEYLRTADPARGGGAALKKPSAGRDATAAIRPDLHTHTSLSTAALLNEGQRNMAAQLLIAEAEAAMSEGKWEVAIDNCFSVILSDPEYLPVHMMLGDIYLAQGKAEEAIAKYGVVMDTYVARNEPGIAADACRRLLELEPDNRTLKTRLGLLLLDAGEVDEAARALLTIAEGYDRAGDTKAALAEAEALKAKMPTSSDVALAVGTYKLVLGETREAVAELGRALQLDPSNDAALVRLYLSLAWLNDPTQWDALDSLLNRASRDESDTRLFLEEVHAGISKKPMPAVYYGLSLIADRAGLAEVAADALDDGLIQMSLAPTAELDPTWALIEALMCQFRGDLALNDKAGPVAIQHYKRALQILEAHGVIQRAVAEGEAAPEPPPSTLESPRPQHAFLRVPVPVQLYFSLAEAYILIEDWDGALVALESLKALTPADQSVYTRMADIHFRQGHLTQALGDLNELLVIYQKANDHEKTLEALSYMAKLAPSNTAVRRKLADMYIKLGMTDYGLAEMATLADLQLKAGQLKEAMRTYQKSADIHYTLGQHEEAIHIYERIVRLAPRDIDTRQQLVNMYIMSGKTADAVEAERGLADIYIGDGQVEGAIAALHQLLALAPEDVKAHHSLAQQLVSIGEYGQAARLYGRLVRLEPENDRNPILQEEMQRMAREAAAEAEGPTSRSRNSGPLKKNNNNTGPLKKGNNNSGPLKKNTNTANLKKNNSGPLKGSDVPSEVGAKAGAKSGK